MPIINGKIVLDPKTKNKWFSRPKIVNKCKPAGLCLSEFSEQVNFVKWLREKGYKFSAIPLSTWTSFSQQNKNKATGVMPGLPDLLIIVNNSLVWIELKKIDRKSKTGKGFGGLSLAQVEWLKALNSCDNCSAHVAYGSEEAKSIIMELDKMST